MMCWELVLESSDKSMKGKDTLSKKKCVTMADSIIERFPMPGTGDNISRVEVDIPVFALFRYLIKAETGVNALEEWLDYVRAWEQQVIRYAK